MLEKSFIHIPGVGRMTEQEIWASGIEHWEDFIKNHNKLNMVDETKRRIAEMVSQSIIELEKGNINFFSDKRRERSKKLRKF